ncbi:FecCD family ABC transporter permease [Shewanella surugensis]|uniref:Iron ABC transporter permease n=1 Tax=Shewanella surugensis TaxID=212020 RepID=A0ABT0LGS3_9GAMM|nr:iron ABC transporter permease [Shewanella surugensis]MCL1126889.1 iron ABC transporter permease [Shewanella surugensis]
MLLLSQSGKRFLRFCWIPLGLCLGFFTLLFAGSFGAAEIHSVDVLQSLSFHLFGIGESLGLKDRIIMELRLPRVLLAFVAGAGLSVAGSVLQTVTRNPLADPYLFGISSGASFGAVVVLTLLGQGVLSSHGVGWIGLPLGAFIGAGLSVFIVLSMCGNDVGRQVERMLLSGVAVSFMFGALSSLLLYFSSPQAAASVLFWSLGSFAKATWSGLMLPVIVVISCTGIILLFKRQIIAMKMGDETAHTLGINVSLLRLGMLSVCSVITAVLVASCGGIGFVGLMIPHIVRLLFPGQLSLMLTAMLGGIFMIWIDVLARTLLSYQELPVGIITAVIGSTFFLFVLRRRHQEA